jgi:hypothetical protein
MLHLYLGGSRNDATAACLHNGLAGVLRLKMDGSGSWVSRKKTICLGVW